MIPSVFSLLTSISLSNYAAAEHKIYLEDEAWDQAGSWAPSPPAFTSSLLTKRMNKLTVCPVSLVVAVGEKGETIKFPFQGNEKNQGQRIINDKQFVLMNTLSICGTLTYTSCSLVQEVIPCEYKNLSGFIFVQRFTIPHQIFQCNGLFTSSWQL